MISRYWIGYDKFAAGEPLSSCTTADEIRGWLAAQQGAIVCDTVDMMTRDGYSKDEIDDFLDRLDEEYSIEDDYEWIRLGC